MKAVQFSVILFLLGTYSTLLGQVLILRVDPSPDAEILLSVDSADPLLSIGGPVLDEQQANEGWMWGEYEGAFTGYLPDQKISKDLLPVVGAIIRAQPEAEAKVLTTVTQEDLDENRITTHEPGLWWEIEFTKTIPVYFQQEQPKTPVALVPAESAKEQPVVTEALKRAPDPLVEDATVTVINPMIEPVAQVAPVPVEPIERATVPSANLPTTLTGKLQSAKKRWIFLAPPYPYELVDASGSRIAFLDLGQSLLNQPISAFLNKTVRAYGLIVTTQKGRNPTLRVTHLRQL
mgnify:CR=1 FL=1